MRFLKILAVAALLAFAGCSERTCLERGKPPAFPFPHAGVTVG